MRSASLFAFLAMSAAPALFAGPCVPDLLSNYILLGGTGCQLGPFNMVNFSFTLNGPSTFTILPSDITVTPGTGPISFGLNFTSPKFNLTAPTDVAKYLLAYTWDPGDLRSLEDIMNATTPVFPGFATITTDSCPGAVFVGASCVNPIQTVTVTDNGMSATLTATTNYGGPIIGILGIRNNIDLEANGASSEITGFQNVVFLPEPSTLMGGLLGLAAMACRSRLNRRQRGLEFLPRFRNRAARLDRRQ